MKKYLKRGMILLSCGAVLALGGAVLYSRVGLQADASTLPKQQIILDAGQGDLNVKSVTLTQEGTLPALPVPTRTGWEFVGWFDGEVLENFWGDDEAENAGATEDYKLLKQAYAASGYQNVLYQEKVVPVEELSADGDRGWKELTFNWVCLTKGSEVHTGEATDATTLYAMYRAERYTVSWHLNGWLNTFDEVKTAHRTLPEHGGYFVNYELDQFPSLHWENHEFLGWYSDPACTQEYAFHQVGAYQINESPVSGDVHLYAKWTSSVPFDGEIRFKTVGDLIEPKLNATFKVNCVYTLGASKDMPIITGWESSAAEAVVLESFDQATASATFAIRDTAIFKDGNKHITIYVTVDGERYPAAELTIGHSWGGIVKEIPPTCLKGGQTVYGCKYCNETKTVQHEASGHRFVQTDHPATCTEDAYSEIHCIVCGLHEVHVAENSKLGHSLTVETIADCFGTTTITTCTLCGLTETAFDADAIVHHWNWYPTVDRPATCVDEGVQSVHCLNCDARKEETALPATGEHTWGEWQVEREATSEESGVMSRACAVCGKTQSQELPVLTPEPEPEEEHFNQELESSPALAEQEKEESVASAETASAVFSATGSVSGLQKESKGHASRLWLLTLILPLLGGIGAVIFVLRRHGKKN